MRSMLQLQFVPFDPKVAICLSPLLLRVGNYMANHQPATERGEEEESHVRRFVSFGAGWIGALPTTPFQPAHGC